VPQVDPVTILMTKQQSSMVQLNDGFFLFRRKSLRRDTSQYVNRESLFQSCLFWMMVKLLYGDCNSRFSTPVQEVEISLFLAKDFIPLIEQHLIPFYRNQKISSFKVMAGQLEEFRINGQKLHTAIRYGFSQANSGRCS